MESKSQNQVYVSQGGSAWTKADNYVLCALLEKEYSTHRISQLIKGRTEGAITAQKYKLKEEDKLNPNYWKARLTEAKEEVPEIPTFRAVLGVPPKEDSKPVSVEVMVDDNVMRLGIGSEVSVSCGAARVEIRVTPNRS